MLERFRPLTDAAEPLKGAGADFIPDEFFLLLPLLRIRASQGGMLEAVLVSVVDKVSPNSCFYVVTLHALYVPLLIVNHQRTGVALL